MLKKKSSVGVTKLSIDVDMVGGKTTCTLDNYKPEDLKLKPLRNYYHLLTDTTEDNRKQLSMQFQTLAQENGRTLLYRLGNLNWHNLRYGNVGEINTTVAINLLTKFLTTHTDNVVLYTFGNVRREMADFISRLTRVVMAYESSQLKKGKHGTKKLTKKLEGAFTPFAMAMIGYVTLLNMGYFTEAHEIKEALQVSFFPLDILESVESVSEEVLLLPTDPGVENTCLH